MIRVARCGSCAAAFVLCIGSAHAEGEVPAQLPQVTVVGVSPLPGLDLPKDRVPAPAKALP